MLKRGLSVFLAAALMILCFFSVPVFAAEPDLTFRIIPLKIWKQ